MNNNAYFASQLQLLMKEKGKTQKDICTDLGFDKSVVSCWVRGRNKPEKQSVEKLCEYFGCSSDYLLGYETNDLSIRYSELEYVVKYRMLNKEHKRRLMDVLDYYLKEEEK